MPFTVSEIAQRLSGEVIGDGTVVITGFAPTNAAKPGDLTFAENEAYFLAACQSSASAILVSGDWPANGKALIRVKDARVAFAKALPLFFSEPPVVAGIHSTAVIGALAQVDPTACVGPHCVVEDGAKIGPRSQLTNRVTVGARCTVGADVRLFPGVTIYADTVIGDRVRIHSGTVIGADGFGYVLSEGRHLKVPQIGNVVIGDDVEIGANVTVDRGALGSTVIGRGTKIDNLVQIAHNVIVGEHCIVCSQAGVSGSTHIGDYTTLAGQAGVAGHLKIGSRVVVMAQAGVMTDIPDGEHWLGAPAAPDRDMKRQFIAVRQLPGLLHKIKRLLKSQGE